MSNRILINRHLIGEYPVKDGHREHYAKHPLKKGKHWIAVRVSIDGGYLSIDADFKKNPTIHKFKTEEECQKACDIHNNWIFKTDTVKGKKRLDAILCASFA